MKLHKYLACMLLFFLGNSLQVSAQNCVLSYAEKVKKIALNDSVTIAYQEKGKSKTVLLMLHGLGGNMSHWQQNFEALAQHYHCIAIDLPSYGLSSMKNYQSPDILDFYSRAILGFIKKKKLKNVVLAGHSMGGQIAMITALKNEKSIKKLILVAPAGLETFSEIEAKMLKQYATPEFFKKQPEAAIRAGFQKNFFAMPASTETLIQDRLAIGQCEQFAPYFTMVSEGVKGMLQHPVRKQLKDIRLKTLVLYGENDELIPNKLLHKNLSTKEVNQIAKEIPNVQIEGISQAGHLVMFEQAEKCNALIINFLK